MTRSEWPFVSLGAMIAMAALLICYLEIRVLEQRATAAESRAADLERDTIEAAQALFGARVDLVACVQQLHGK